MPRPHPVSITPNKAIVFLGTCISLKSTNKTTYHNVLNRCDDGWHESKSDPTPFVKYLLGITLSAHRDFVSQVYLFDKKLPTLELVRKAIS